MNEKYFLPHISMTNVGGDGFPEDFFNEAVFEADSVPVLPLRNIVAFPFLNLPVELGRASSIRLAEEAEASHELVMMLAQRDPEVETPGRSDLYNIGVLCRILKLIELPDGNKAALTFCGPRVRLAALKRKSPYLRGRIELCSEVSPEEDDKEMAVLFNLVQDVFNRIMNIIGEENTKELRYMVNNIDNPLRKINIIAANAPLSPEEKQHLLEIDSLKGRASALLKALTEAEQYMMIRADIQHRTQEDISRQQREVFLQQQMRTIQSELGVTDEDADIEELRNRAASKNWTQTTRKHFEKELAKLERLNISNPEYSVQYNYLDTLLSLPWNTYSNVTPDLDRVSEILDRDHFGLEKVKERILEHISVLKLRGDMKSPILCLYGPPGVGKTSLGKSVAEALGRDYQRISLGGVHDEAEIRGHRRTYIGSMPGRIITALSKCKTGDPVIVLDEIDKIGSDFKGDPSTALLEALDPEQNNKFHDNFIDTDYDLSKVLFLATANTLQGISRPLLDRMELVDISGYITEEKTEIALRHLVPKLLDDHGFKAGEIKFTPAAILEIIENYTRESGVRRLEKRIAEILRKIAVKKAAGIRYPKTITPKLVVELLPAEQRIGDPFTAPDCPGVATGLAWTEVGGETLLIETSLNPGKEHKLTLTGNLGNVMKESAAIALQHLRANAEKYGIDPKKFEDYDLHIHVPEGAIPKDGPSAGITMATSMLSALTDQPVKKHLAMTGEITLLGYVMPVGGIKEKILAAKRVGVTDIVLSAENRKDIEAIPAAYLQGMSFHYVRRFSEVKGIAF